MLPRARVHSLVRSCILLGEVKNLKKKFQKKLLKTKPKNKKKTESFPGKAISNLVKSLVFRNDV